MLKDAEYTTGIGVGCCCQRRGCHFCRCCAAGAAGEPASVGTAGPPAAGHALSPRSARVVEGCAGTAPRVCPVDAPWGQAPWLEAARARVPAQVQREAVAAVARAFGARRAGDDDPPAAAPSAAAAASGSGARATVVLPSGAGKTVVALRAAEELRPGLTLVLVPSIALVSQSYREWERWRERDHLSGWRPLAVVSSSSVPASELPRTTSATTASSSGKRLPCSATAARSSTRGGGWAC